VARYDGIAQWYDDRVAAHAVTAAIRDSIASFLGNRTGTLLDIGCGTGFFFSTFASAGWRVTAVDPSEDQLRLARSRADPLGIELLRANAEDLPFRDASFDAACLLRVLTDVDEPTAVLREAARVIRGDGTIVLATLHPCFVGPYVRFHPDGSRDVLPGYRQSGWHATGPGIGDGVRSRVGVRHITLAELLTAIAQASLHIEKAVEPGEEAIPTLLMLRLRYHDQVAVG
jgi:ubiquinone/menaquinone biosynthesis C-methylase UbiE